MEEKEEKLQDDVTSPHRRVKSLIPIPFDTSSINEHLRKSPPKTSCSPSNKTKRHHHRRVKSLDYSTTDFVGLTGGPQPKAKTYTKSLGELVKHLATPAGQPSPSPKRRNIFQKTVDLFEPLNEFLAGRAYKIWSPNAEEVVNSTVEDDELNSLDYEFVLILRDTNKKHKNVKNNPNLLDEIGQKQAGIIENCLNAGLEITVLSSTLHTREYICLLLKPTPTRLKVEKNRLILERWLQVGAVGEVPSEIEHLIATSSIGIETGWQSEANSNEEYDTNYTDANEEEDWKTTAERIQTIGRIISSTSDKAELNPPGAGIPLEEKSESDNVVVDCFPLHNRKVNKEILNKFNIWWWKSDEITNDLRFHFGERVAFYFSFVFLYTKFIFIPAILGTTLYISLRWLSAIYYMRALSVFGFVIVTIWGTLFLKFWCRENERLKDAWNVRLFKEAEYPNPSFKAQGYQDIVDSHGVVLFQEPYYNSMYRIPVYIQTFAVFALFLGTYIFGISFFVQWYTAAMLAPVCSECTSCTEFLSCFNTLSPTVFTWRWLYILVQGIILGIVLDIFVYVLSVKLLRFFIFKENYATEARVQRTIINRLFVLNWISFFLWFLLIAFVIVPFGKQLEKFLAENLHVSQFTVDWENGRIDMSTALVTPLLITQGLNLLIDTFLPYIITSETLKAAKRSSKLKSQAPNLPVALTDDHSEVKPISPSQNTSSTTTSMDYSKTKIELKMMIPSRIPIIEKRLGVIFPVVEGFHNGGFMTSDDVVEESSLSHYSSFADYLKMVMQFGYIVMFTVVWPFCPLAALVNNMVHIRNSIYKLLVHRRRSVPRKANSIGQWEKTLLITLVLANFVVVGLICISSGELEYFTSSCLSQSRFNGTDFRMTPEFSCLSLSDRFLVALSLEHLAVLIIYIIRDNVSNTPSSLKLSFRRKKALIRRAIAGQKPSMSTCEFDGEDV